MLALVSLALVACQSGDALESKDIGETVQLVIGAEGGSLQTTHEGIRYELIVPPGALEEDTEISMTPARLVGVSGAVAARFAPDGLSFAIPATLHLDQRPEGEILVAVQAGPSPVEAELAVSLLDGVYLPITHFSTHAAVDANAVIGMLPADVRARVEALKGLDPDALAVIGVGDFYRSHVEPVLPLLARDVHGFEIAGRSFISWLLIANSLSSDAQDLPHELGGSQSLADLVTQVMADVVAGGTEVLGRLTRPACTGTPDVLSALDWARLPEKLAGILGELGARPQFESCATSRVLVTGPTSIDANTSEVHLGLSFEVLGPDGSSQLSDADYFFERIGVDGPDTLKTTDTTTDESNDGNLSGERDVVFTRATGNDRPRTVTIEVRAASAATDLGFVPAPPPHVFEVVEAGTSLTLTTTPAQLDNASDRSELCAIVQVDEQPLLAFKVDFVVNGPGSLDSVGVVTTDGQACVHYAPPVPLPANAEQVTIEATAVAAFGQLRKSATISLGSGGLQVAMAATPASAATAGAQVQACATVTSDGIVVGDYEVQFALAGPGQITDTSVISVSTSDGVTCTTYTAPDPLGAVAEATVSAQVTTAQLAADGSVTIPLGVITPLVSVAANQVSDPLICGGMPSQNVAAAFVTHPDTGAPLADLSVSFELDGTLIGTALTDAAGDAVSPLFPVAFGDHVITARVGLGSGQTPYHVNFEQSCLPCADVVCGRAAGDPPGITVCLTGADASCSFNAFCACQAEGCRNDGPFLHFDANDVRDGDEYHCREQ